MIRSDSRSNLQKLLREISRGRFQARRGRKSMTESGRSGEERTAARIGSKPARERICRLRVCALVLYFCSCKLKLWTLLEESKKLTHISSRSLVYRGFSVQTTTRADSTSFSCRIIGHASPRREYASARLSLAIYGDLYRRLSTCYSLASRGAGIAVTRSRVDDEKEIRRRQAPLASNYRAGFS